MGNPAGGAAVTEKPLTDLEQEIVDNVQKYGCFIMSVFDPDGEEPEFSYSIGFLRTVQQPEVITFSLPRALRVSMINEIYRQISENGLQLVDGVGIAGLLEGHSCVAREVTDQKAISEHFGSAIWYSRRFDDQEINKVFQIVWPGARQGLFPWEDGCASEVIEDQPALYAMGAVH
jgi:hypothetical protein